MNEKRVFSVLVNNHFGVLTRVAGLFARRGYNIDSLTVGVTEDPEFSRMTIVARGDHAVFEQIGKQLDKLIDVKHIEVLTQDDAIIRQLMFIKVNTVGQGPGHHKGNNGTLPREGGGCGRRIRYH